MLVDSETLYVPIPPPVCNVFAKSIDWVSFAEKTDWSGPMVATYTGVATAEEACNSVVVNLKIKDADTGLVIAKETQTTTKEGTYTYKFTGSVEVNNTQGWYIGEMVAYDASDDSDKDTISTLKEYWDPPCYLQINKFNKTGETTRADGTKADLSYKLALAQYGDNACRDSSAVVTLSDETGATTFVHHLQ